MAGFTTASIIGAAVLGAGATVYSVNQNKKLAKDQAAAIDAKEQEAIDTAKEQASLDAARDDTGADVRLGRQDSTTSNAVLPTPSVLGASNQSGSVQGRVGGVKPRKRKASTGVGL